MQISILLCFVSLLIGSSLSEVYRTFEIELVIKLFKVLSKNTSATLDPNGNGAIPITELERNYKSIADAWIRNVVPRKNRNLFGRATSSKLFGKAKKDSKEISKSELKDFTIKELIAYAKSLPESSQVANYCDRNRITRQTDADKMTTYDLLKLFDPANDLGLQADQIRLLLSELIFAFMDEDLSGFVQFDELEKFYSGELEGLPRNELAVIFKKITSDALATGKLSLQSWLDECEEFKSVLFLLTFKRLYIYDEVDIMILSRFFQGLSTRNVPTAELSLNVVDVRDKYLGTLPTEFTKGSISKILGAGFQNWVECLISAAWDENFVETHVVADCPFKSVAGAKDRFDARQLARLLDPINAELLKVYNLHKNIPRMFFVKMDDDYNGKISPSEFKKYYKETLKVELSDEQVKGKFEFIATKKSALSSASIDLETWEFYCEGYSYVASIFSQKALVAAAA